VRTRTRVALLDARTEVARGERRFVRGERYRALPRGLSRDATRAFERYVSRIDEDERVEASHMEVIDLAFRVAGTGSLGGLRVAVLARGKGGADGAWIFDMKEQGTPSGAVLVGVEGVKPAKRVVSAMRACLAHPPRMLGTTKLAGRSMLVRRLTPQEDKLDLTHIAPSDLEPLARYLGALTGAAHKRAAETRPAVWTKGDREKLIDRAIVLAQIHEGAYLAMCKATR
jgi:uncharacterized protein (DUF2252 family)